jgi:hypothetical protein
VRTENVVAFGFGEAAEPAKAGMQQLPPRLRTIDLDDGYFLHDANLTLRCRRWDPGQRPHTLRLLPARALTESETKVEGIPAGSARLCLMGAVTTIGVVTP